MRLIIPTALAAAIVAVGLYFLLIPLYGFVGVAWATAGGLWSASIFVGIVSTGSTLCREWRRVGLAVGVTLGLALPRSPWTPARPSTPRFRGWRSRSPIRRRCSSEASWTAAGAPALDGCLRRR